MKVYNWKSIENSIPVPDLSTGKTLKEGLSIYDIAAEVAVVENNDGSLTPALIFRDSPNYYGARFLIQNPEELYPLPELEEDALYEE